MGCVGRGTPEESVDVVGGGDQRIRNTRILLQQEDFKR